MTTAALRPFKTSNTQPNSLVISVHSNLAKGHIGSHMTWYTESYHKTLVGDWYTWSHKLFPIRKAGGVA